MTNEQRGVLRHALGLHNETETYSYRNHYAAEPDDKICNEMVDAGFMRKGRIIPGGLQYFEVTEEGKEVAMNPRVIEA